MRSSIQAAWRWLASPINFAIGLVALLPIGYLLVFMVYYAPATPIIDTAELNGGTVLALADGSFRWQMVFESFNGHRPVFAHLLTIANYYLTGWNQYAELAVIVVMALANVCLLLVLVAHVDPGLVRWALLPVLFMWLSPTMGLTWLAGVYSTWHFNLLFVLLALLLIVKLPRRWWALPLIIGASALPMLSLTQGVLMWGIGMAALWMTGHSKRTVVLYGLVGVALVLWYAQGALVTVSADPAQELDTRRTVSLESPVTLLRFVLVYLGAPLGMERPTPALVAGIAGCGLLAAQMLYLAKRGDLRRVWLLLLLAGYVLGTAGIVGLGRIDFLGVEVALVERYQHSAWVFWCVVVLLTLMALRSALGAGHFAVMRANIAVLVVFGGVFAVCSYLLTPTFYTAGYAQPLENLRGREQCTRDLLLRDVATCVEYAHFLVQELAVAGVAAYEDIGAPAFVDDPALRDGHVVVMTENPWTSYFIYRHTLPGAPHERAFLLLPDGTQDDYNRILELSDVPVPAAYTHNDADALRTQLAGAPGVWLVHDESLDTEPVLTLNDADYALLRRWRQRYDIAVQHYLPLHTGEQQVRFGDEMTLVGWQIPAALEVTPCSTLPLHTFWQAAVDEGERANSYGLSLVLAGADGVGVSAANGATSLDTTDWRAEHYYADARTVEIPCDAPTGEYPLLLSAYPLDEPGANLPVTAEDGTPLGDFLYLTTVFIAQ